MKKQTRLDQLIAVSDRFHSLLEATSSERAAEWVGRWRALRTTYLSPPAGVRRSQLSAGLLQGVLEWPLLFGAMPAADRQVFAKAYKEAFDTEYPELLRSQAERLGRIVAKGRISNESQFYLVRHAIDILEDEHARAHELERLYELADAFETRR